MNWIRHFTHAGLLDVTVIANIFLVYQMYYLSKESTFLGITEESCEDFSKLNNKLLYIVHCILIITFKF